jgi:hypothetical protein
METIKIVSTTIAEKEVKQVEITPEISKTVLPLDVYLRDLNMRKSMLEKQLADVNAKLVEVTEQIEKKPVEISK